MGKEIMETINGNSIYKNEIIKNLQSFTNEKYDISYPDDYSAKLINTQDLISCDINYSNNLLGYILNVGFEKTNGADSILLIEDTDLYPVEHDKDIFENILSDTCHIIDLLSKDGIRKVIENKKILLFSVTKNSIELPTRSGTVINFSKSAVNNFSLK